MIKAVLSVWWTTQNKLLEVIKNAKFKKVRVVKDELDHKKTMDAYKFLAKKIQERNIQNKQKGKK